MPATVRVGFKFCGNCNPGIDAKAIYKEIAENINKSGCMDIVTKNDQELDVLIVISGCPIDCAERPQNAIRIISVAGESVDFVNCLPEKIAGVVLQKLKNQVLLEGGIG